MENDWKALGRPRMSVASDDYVNKLEPQCRALADYEQVFKGLGRRPLVAGRG